MSKNRATWNVDPDVVHNEHSMDHYPLCWPMDAEGEFKASLDEAKVTCPDCLEFLE